ncbi:phosphatase PAP2 family protein [Glycomyces xiaoerkulensis]|uniref:phosphatase PAP2 family protein n=1 Tax=Glycomyces xiaoerkulensis TaxID=2038139 RepID=UPI000C2661FC|nr:phosphatase PAP2 family protein [Glycomyces xiaoerkulensis]
MPRPFPKPAATLPIAALLVLGPAAVAWWIRNDPDPPFQPLDDAWLRLTDGSHDGLLWNAAVLFDRVGARPGTIAVLALAVLLVAMRRWWSALFAVAAATASGVLIDLLKLFGGRERPPENAAAVASLAFPSGHSAWMAAVVVAFTVIAVPVGAHWWWPVAGLLVLGMMWSRTWLHAHWPTDTAAGAAVGVGTAMLCWWGFNPLLGRERARRADRGPARTDAAGPQAGY